MRAWIVCFVTVACQAAPIAFGPPASGAMPLYLLSKEMSIDRGAVCLDGTAPGFYFSPANNTINNTKWVIYLKGGGWCYNESECAARARSEYGSSRLFSKTFEFVGGILDSNQSNSPDFAGFNRALLWYCDGASFSGNNPEPYHFALTNQTLYFRGARVLRAMLDTLLADHGLGDATEVLLAGGSAGGLATFHNADRIGEYLRVNCRGLSKYKAAPVSGFFLEHASADGNALYPDRTKYMYEMQHAEGGVNAACLESYVPWDRWRCFFANESYAHTRTPMFPLQSALDKWQMENIWQGDKVCTWSSFKDCTKGQIADLNAWRASMLEDLQRTDKFSRDGEGGFVESCYEHVAAQGYSFNEYEIQGTTMQQALSKWWAGEGQEPQWYLPCELTDAAPHQCNPSCGAQHWVPPWTSNSTEPEFEF